MKTLIILHGWQSKKENWQEVKNYIESEGVEVIVPDLPGFKPETELKRAWNLDDYVLWLKDFSQEREQFFLLGHSFGGRIAIKFALKYPKKLQGLILVSAAGLKARKNLKDIFAFILAKVLKPFSWLPGFNLAKRAFYKKFLRKTDYLEAKGMMKEVFKKIIREDLEPLLSQIKTKTLLIWGREDKITPLRDGLRMKEKIPGSEIEILEGVGHAPNLKNPRLLAEKIKEFLQ